MRNIIVTTPKSESEKAKLEADFAKKNENSYYFRSFKKLPKDIDVGSKVFYVDNGEITGFCVISEINKEKKKCDVTGREFEGFIVKMPANSWKWIRPIRHKGFQGFRYFDFEEYKIIGDWKDEKPKMDWYKIDD